jgi:hypothetical protein
VFGALTEVTAGGSSAPISWWVGANRQVAPRRPHGGGRILFTCTFLRSGGRDTHTHALCTAAWSLPFHTRGEVIRAGASPRGYSREAACPGIGSAAGSTAASSALITLRPRPFAARAGPGPAKRQAQTQAADTHPRAFGVQKPFASFSSNHLLPTKKIYNL